MSVGRSSRTPYKHWLLNWHLGKVAGVLSVGSGKVPAVANPFLCIDLCAGDGVETESHLSSPGIILKHCRFLADRGKYSEVVLIEKQALTFKSLKESLVSMPSHEKIELVTSNTDARDFVLEPAYDNQAIFINCDPNSISEMPLASSVSEAMTRGTTFVLTLGCNVGGLKRLPREERQKWFDYVATMLETLPSWHDAIIVEIAGDAAQWAYFVRWPNEWVPDALKSLKRKGDSIFKKGINIASIRTDSDAFESICHRLFLTKKERAV